MNRRFLILTSAAIGFTAGTILGNFYAKKRLEAKYAQQAEEEIDEARTYFKTLYKVDELSTPEGALKQRIPGNTLTDVDRADTTAHEGPPIEVLEKVMKGLKYGNNTLTRNVFDGMSDPGTDHTEEDEARDPMFPYIISMEEFLQNEAEYIQVTYTFYAGDDVLADEEEMPVDEVEKLVGNHNLDKFGHRSKDPRVVYIRNDKLDMDFEILKHDGTYAREVAGIDEIRHSAVRKFRKE